MSENLKNQIKELLDSVDLVNRHSLFQLKYFVVGKEPTLQARMRKCIDELAARKSNIDNILLSIEEARDDTELLDLEIKETQENTFTNNLNRKRAEIGIRKLERKKRSLEATIKDLQKTLKECEEEAEFFLRAFKELEKIEPLKPFDDFETNASIWNEKYYQHLNLSLLLQKPLDLEVVKTILSLDKATPIRAELINILDQIQQRALLEQQKPKMERLEESKCQKESQV